MPAAPATSSAPAAAGAERASSTTAATETVSPETMATASTEMTRNPSAKVAIRPSPSSQERSDAQLGYGRDWESAIVGNGDLCCPSAVACFLSTIFPCAWLGGFKTLQESAGMVFLVNGKLAATRTEPGMFCVNPCCTRALEVSTRQATVDLQATKIIDARGNPIRVSAVVVYRVQNIVRAALEVENLHAFVVNAATATLKTTLAQYPYAAPPSQAGAGQPQLQPHGGGQPWSLKTHGVEIGHEVAGALQDRVAVAGVMVVDVLLNELSYAREIASAMLQTQQAESLVDARTLIVQGAVEIVRNAAQNLASSGIAMDGAERSRMVNNLICIICASGSK